MIIKKEHEAKVSQLFSMNHAGPNEKEIIKELATEYLGAAQVAVTCWTCPASVQSIYKMLTTALTGYQVEQPKQKEDEKTNEGIGPEATKTNSRKAKKGPNSGTDGSNI